MSEIATQTLFRSRVLERLASFNKWTSADELLVHRFELPLKVIAYLRARAAL